MERLLVKNRERAKLIQQELLDTNNHLTQKEIAKKYGVARTTVTAINQEVNVHDDSLTYPLRKPRTNSPIDQKTASLIKKDLLETNLSQREIADKYQVNQYIISDINVGKTYRDTR